MPLKQIAVAGLKAVRLHSPLQELRNHVTRPDWWVQEQRFRKLLRPFVPKGCLAFDIGANHGQYAQRLLAMGAGKVVSAEPQPQCAAHVRERFAGDARLHLVEQAVGATAGTTTLYLCEGDQVSSCDPKWQDRFPKLSWQGSVEVPITTLDALIAEHGRPAFCKVDVEGFEPQVLRGLSQPIDVICLEMTARLEDNTRAMLRRLRDLGYEHVNFAQHLTYTFRFPEPLTPEQAEPALTTSLPEPRKGGDIYAFLCAP